MEYTPKVLIYVFLTPHPTLSWSFRKIFYVKDKLANWIHQQTYNLKEVYIDCCADGPVVSWTKFMWDKSSIPKAKFIL